MAFYKYNLLVFPNFIGKVQRSPNQIHGAFLVKQNGIRPPILVEHKPCPTSFGWGGAVRAIGLHKLPASCVEKRSALT